jgi:hypothetical protein
MAKTGRGNFELKFIGPWRGTQHVWSVTSSHTGAAFSASADITSFMQDVHARISSFIGDFWSGSTLVYCAGYAYYDGVHSAAVQEEAFASLSAAVAAGFDQTHYGTAYTGSGQPMSPECAVRLEAPVGLSSTGKPVSIKKFIHFCQGPGLSPAISSTGTAQAAALGNGDLYGSRILCSGSGKTGAWSVYTYFSNHQMNRRRKKKTTA